MDDWHPPVDVGGTSRAVDSRSGGHRAAAAAAEPSGQQGAPAVPVCEGRSVALAGGSTTRRRMRIGTWNLAGRWTPEHERFLLAADCDVWLLTEVNERVRLDGFAR